jgi:hypothetical protein
LLWQEDGITLGSLDHDDVTVGALCDEQRVLCS